MKKPFIILFLICFFCAGVIVFLPLRSVSAKSTYLRVITENTPFYQKTTDTEPLFLLPYTYYVKVIETSNSFTHVECSVSNGVPAIDGFVPTDMLFFDGLLVTEPYLNLNVKTSTTAILFEDASLSTPIQYVFPEREMHYYGKNINKQGHIIYYVSYNDRLGYVKEADIYPFTYQNHPNELTFLYNEEPPISQNQNTSQTTDKDRTLSIKIIIVACLLFAGIIALIFTIKNKSLRNVGNTIYDENDYE